jgi:hypothetical protein
MKHRDGDPDAMNCASKVTVMNSNDLHPSPDLDLLSQTNNLSSKDVDTSSKKGCILSRDLHRLVTSPAPCSDLELGSDCDSGVSSQRSSANLDEEEDVKFVTESERGASAADNLTVDVVVNGDCENTFQVQADDDEALSLDLERKCDLEKGKMRETDKGSPNCAPPPPPPQETKSTKVGGKVRDLEIELDLSSLKISGGDTETEPKGGQEEQTNCLEYDLDCTENREVDFKKEAEDDSDDSGRPIELADAIDRLTLEAGEEKDEDDSDSEVRVNCTVAFYFHENENDENSIHQKFAI